MAILCTPPNSPAGPDGTSFLAAVGVKDPFIVVVVLDVVQAGTAIPGIWAVERLGRRPLLVLGAIAMSALAYTLAILSSASSPGAAATERAIVVLITLHIAAYSLSWGPLARLLPNEIIPMPVRAKAISLCGAIAW